MVHARWYSGSSSSIPSVVLHTVHTCAHAVNNLALFPSAVHGRRRRLVCVCTSSTHIGGWFGVARTHTHTLLPSLFSHSHHHHHCLDPAQSFFSSSSFSSGLAPFFFFFSDLILHTTAAASMASSSDLCSACNNISSIIGQAGTVLCLLASFSLFSLPALRAKSGEGRRRGHGGPANVCQCGFGFGDGVVVLCAVASSSSALCALPPPLFSLSSPSPPLCSGRRRRRSLPLPLTVASIRSLTVVHYTTHRVRADQTHTYTTEEVRSLCA